MSVDLSTKTDTREEAITRNNDNNSKYLNEDHILSDDDDELGNTHKRMDVDNIKKSDIDLIGKDKSDNETLADKDSHYHHCFLQIT
jgi:hypothetical protein